MDTNLALKLDQPIVALACEDFNEQVHFICPETPFSLSEIDYRDDAVQAGEIVLPRAWYNTILICTQETYDRLTEKLGNA